MPRTINLRQIAINSWNYSLTTWFHGVYLSVKKLAVVITVFTIFCLELIRVFSDKAYKIFSNNNGIFTDVTHSPSLKIPLLFELRMVTNYDLDWKSEMKGLLTT